jgi:hypothetical protein
MSAPLTEFNETIATLVKTRILTPLSEWLEENKSVSVSVDELLDALYIPKVVKSSQSPFISAAPPSFPQHLSGKQVKKQKEDTTPTDGPKCKYIYKKGKNANQPCGKICVEGYEFCKNCLEKGSTKVAPVSQATKSTNLKAKTVSTTLGFTASLKKANKPTLEFRETETEGVYEDAGTRFLVRKVMNNGQEQYVAFGVREDDGIRELTESEKALALKKKLSVQVTEDESTTPMVQEEVKKPLPAKKQVPVIPVIDESDEE